MHHHDGDARLSFGFAELRRRAAPHKFSYAHISRPHGGILEVEVQVEGEVWKDYRPSPKK